MADRELFYAERDARTTDVLGRRVDAEKPVHIVAGDAACRSEAGQLVLFALVNQMARVHRRITYRLGAPDVPLLSLSAFGGSTIGAAVTTAAETIDPYGDFGPSAEVPAGAVTIGIGHDVETGLNWYVGAERALASLSMAPLSLDTGDRGTLRGAALASCLGASAVFRAIHGLAVSPRTVSAWNYAEGPDGDPGPSEKTPVDVGRVLMVGAGAVASGLTYWLRALGVGGLWMVIDNDVVELHNTNRSLLFLPRHTSWGGGEPALKAQVLAEHLPGGDWEKAWYHESRKARGEYDVVLALANDYDVRTLISTLSSPLVLHATTGENWISQLHRHIVGRDDCIHCRTGEVRKAAFRCSEGELPPTATEQGGDAALPFLSAAAGLMLVTGLQRLQAGALEQGPENDWRWYWDSSHRMFGDSIRSCRDGCRQVQPQTIRQAMHDKTRWAYLDR